MPAPDLDFKDTTPKKINHAGTITTGHMFMSAWNVGGTARFKSRSLWSRR